MIPEDLVPGATVRFLLEHEEITGSHLPALAMGVIAEEPVVHACSRRQIVPILVAAPEDEIRLVWITADRILTASLHPSGGFP